MRGRADANDLDRSVAAQGSVVVVRRASKHLLVRCRRYLAILPTASHRIASVRRTKRRERDRLHPGVRNKKEKPPAKQDMQGQVRGKEKSTCSSSPKTGNKCQEKATRRRPDEEYPDRHGGRFFCEPVQSSIFGSTRVCPTVRLLLPVLSKLGLPSGCLSMVGLSST